jgi:pyridoxine 4-dehydrogenase
MTPQPVSAADAGTWKLGDIPVNRLGFGAMRLTQNGAAFAAGAAASDRDQAIATLRRAIELGVNHIDTAAFYFSALRSANELINTALAPYPDDLVIVTKVGPSRDAAGNWGDAARPEQLRGQVEENLRQLGRDHLDVVNYRRQDAASITEHVGALAELRDAGLIREIGISGVGLEHLAQARAVTQVACVQNAYSLTEQRPESAELLRACGEHGIAFVPFFAIAGAGHHKGPGASASSAALTRIAGAHGVTVAQIKLAWTLHQGQHVLAIPGTGNPEHLTENVAAGTIRMSPAELASLAPERAG